MKKRVLQVVRTLNVGGIESFIMSYINLLDKEKYEVDFLLLNTHSNFHETTLLEMNFKIFKLPSIGEVGYFKYKRNINIFFEQHRYDIVHSHMNAMSGLVLKVARKKGIRNTIAHSHTSSPKYHGFEKIIKVIFGIMTRRYSTLRVACSLDSGKWIFKKMDYQVIYNGVKYENFLFNKDHLSDKGIKEETTNSHPILLHVGRFSREKNHIYLINLFERFVESHSNAKLILVGGGPLLDSVKSLVFDLKLERKVLFLGVRSDIGRIMSFADCFLLPSIQEGLPVSLIEAQVNGLPCVVSKQITKEIDLGLGLVHFCELNDDYTNWNLTIDSVNRFTNQKVLTQTFLESDFNLESAVRKLEKLYDGCSL